MQKIVAITKKRGYGKIRYHQKFSAVLTIYSEEIDAQHLILSPCSFHENAAGPIWINIESCAWHGPVDLLEKEPLSEVPEYRDNQKISRLFREILDIKDATWSDYLETLSNLRRLTTLPPNLPEKALKLYQLLLNDGRSTPDWLRIWYGIRSYGLY